MDTKHKFNCSLAKLQHQIWRNKLITLLNGGPALAAVGHHECALGKWIYEEGGMSEYGTLSEMRYLESYHAQFHNKIKGLIDAHSSGNEEKAWSLYEEIKGMSNEILHLIDSLDSRLKKDALSELTQKQHVA